MPSSDEVLQRAGSLRAMTGLTSQEGTALLPHFEHAFLAYMEAHTIDGQPRTSRRDRAYDTSPFPMMADKWLLILPSVQQNPIQEVPGQLVGMSQSNQNTWMHLLHAVLHQALAHHEWLPARTADDFAMRLSAKRTEAGPTTALFCMMGPNDPSRALTIFLGMGVYAVTLWHEPVIKLNRVIIRAVYLAMAAALLGYLGASKELFLGREHYPGVPAGVWTHAYPKAFARRVKCWTIRSRYGCSSSARLWRT